MEKIFTELYKDIHTAVQTGQDPLKKFLFATRQHVLIIFYIASQVGQKTTLEDICYNVSPKVVSRSTIQNILKEVLKLIFLKKKLTKKIKEKNFTKLQKKQIK